jgi:hypothetical protein
MWQWWSDTERIIQKYMEKKLSKLQLFHEESHISRAGIEILVFVVGGK